jgi:hypothetical protein
MVVFRRIAVASVLLLAASTASADVQISLHEGRVTLTATNATVRQILTEWARIGQTTIVNVDRIPGAPMTLQLTDMPEQEALDILLRSVTGYMAAPRLAPVGNLSRYDRILVLPKAAVARAPVASSPASVVRQQPVFQPPPESDDEEPSGERPPRPPLFPTFQQRPVNPQDPNAAGNPGAFQPGQTPNVVPVDPQAGQQIVMPPYPGGAAIGTPRPGMVVQPPAQPGQQVAPGVVAPGDPLNPND